MKQYFAFTGVLFGIAIGVLELAGPARAAALGGSAAADAVDQLRAQGYTVQVDVDNGPRSVALSECTVSDVSGLSGTNSAGKPLTPAQAGTVYVDVNCPDYDDD
jgi:hypothetical protein